MKVSVIIPLFNAEKYLRGCLESLLIQTFADFEVIVVDDASTDNSVAIAESYLERFGGRLKIISLPKNTGNASVPRNEGLRFSRGEYIFFMDNDDLLVDNALEILYNCAEIYRADVVYMERGFLLNGEKFTAATWDKGNFSVDKPTLETPNLFERLEKFLQTGYGWAPWTKFLRRDFLIANEINFPRVKISEDVLWTFKVICHAENFLRVPNRLYVCRSAENSWSRIKREPAEEIKFWLDPLIKGLDYLDDFMDEFEFFAQNPNYRFEVTNFFVKMQVAGMLGALKNLTRYELYEIIHREFNGRHAALIANLFVVMNFYRDKFLEAY
ncbi:MAG: glycosyltransferase family 2 protein [Selenomonadaceae bacterium]|nr:glycosyltransferase family 2 protein [Selenomonadaceae bacterium]